MAPARTRFLQRLLPIANAAAGGAVRALLALVRAFNRVWISNFFGAFTRTVGPHLREQRIGRANLKAAFPEKSDAEIETILRGVWDNLGRVAAELAQVDRIVEGDPAHRKYIEYAPGTAERFKALRDDGKPALIFAAHTGNWELPAVLAAADGLDTLVLYRRPNLDAVADAVLNIRSGHMLSLIHI